MKNLFKALVPAAASVPVFALSAVNAFAEGGSGSGSGSGGGSLLSMFIPLILIFVLMYFLMIRPQKKKEKETKAMQNNIQIGDEIVTIGGIVGLVVRRGDDNVVIETGGEKNKMRIKLWAVSENTTANERIKAAQAEKKAALASGKLKDEESDEKKSKKSKKDSKDAE